MRNVKSRPVMQVKSVDKGGEAPPGLQGDGDRTTVSKSEAAKLKNQASADYYFL